MNDEQQQKKIKSLIEAGGRILGGSVSSVIAAAIGGIVGGAPGILVGGAAGGTINELFVHLGEEFSQRYLSYREKERVGATLGGIIALVQEAQRLGEQQRDDGFFTRQSEGRSDGEEVLEGIIQAAKREYEEKKLPYLMKLGKLSFFRKELTKGIGVQLIHLSEMLSYQELILIAIIGKNSNNCLQLRQSTYAGSKQKFANDILLNSILNDFNHMAGLGLVTNGGAGGVGIASYVPGGMKLFGAGLWLFHGLELNDMPVEELQPYISILCE